ncbi:Uncharacterized protein APZ42_023345 [Daphnia magna]|uniref:Uncharacterized protein n=1 Tax=Daphnia magna TaxID=35525 RepID=A0A164V179_9CRUS|nr:Uncharacterized protein APZ42_023345 [Daphnia magna]
MAEYPPPSSATMKNKLKESHEREEECVANLRDRLNQALSARNSAIEVVCAHKTIVNLNEEIENVTQDLVNVHVHFSSGRETLMSGYIRSLLHQAREMAKEKPVSASVTLSDRPKYVVPNHTPVLPCFLKQHVGKPEGTSGCGRLIAECEEFMTFTNQDRLELLFKQHRCFGCFLPVAVAGHTKLIDCPHPRYCSLCKVSDHHQILCGPRCAYRGVLPPKEN